MIFRNIRRDLCAVIAASLFVPAGLLAQEAVSHVRVVRLSYVSGTVALKRPGSDDWSKAMVNTPIQQGFDVQTSASSYAEVEFENGSTARLGELSRIDFDELALDADGDKLNRLTFEQGYATFHFVPEHHDAYSVKIANATVTPNNKTEFRTDFRQGRVRVEVFNGSIDVVAPSGTAKLGKDKVLEFDANTPEVALNVQHGFEKDSWDKWTESRDTQAQLALRDMAVSPQGPRYGWSDLSTYGEWAYIPGYGNGWSPYSQAGWSPYSMGMWDWYSGMGWTWNSAEPWGWLPYHYGMWNYDASMGWFWMPGNFGFFSPALVSWYSGPSWIGWAPLGVRGGPGLYPITTVSGSVIQNGQMITPQTSGHVHRSQATPIAQLPFQPSTRVLRSGGPVAIGAGASAGTAMGFAGRANASAPATVLMAGDAAKESALLEGHQRGARSHDPLRARMGTTLGGRYAVGGTPGVFRGEPGGAGLRGMNGPSPSFRGSNTGPAILARGQSAGSSHSGGGEMMRGGGDGGGRSSSMPAQSNPSSSPHTPGPSPSGGGRH